MYSIVYVENVYIETIFEWITNHVINCGGDGGARLVCDNYEQAAQWLFDYLKEIDSQGWELTKEEFYITISRDQEGFILTNNTCNLNMYGEINFIIKKDCRFGFTNLEDKRLLKSI